MKLHGENSMNEPIENDVIDEIDATEKRLELLGLLLTENALLKTRINLIESWMKETEDAVNVLIDEASNRNYT